MKIWAKTKEFSEGKYLVVRRDGTVPHWKHFVIGARDPAAPAALRAYADECERRGYDPEYVHSIRELITDFDDYRLEHGRGDPEAPPHRIDDPNVLQVMRGHEMAVVLRPETRNHPKT